MRISILILGFKGLIRLPIAAEYPTLFVALCARGKNFFKLSFMAFSYSLEPLLYRIPNVSTSLRTNKKGVKSVSECLPLFKYFKNGLIKIYDFKAKCSNNAKKNQDFSSKIWRLDEKFLRLIKYFYRYHLPTFVLMVTCSGGLEGGAVTTSQHDSQNCMIIERF